MMSPPPDFPPAHTLTTCPPLLAGWRRGLPPPLLHPLNPPLLRGRRRRRNATRPLRCISSLLPPAWNPSHRAVRSLRHRQLPTPRPLPLERRRRRRRRRKKARRPRQNRPNPLPRPPPRTRLSPSTKPVLLHAGAIMGPSPPAARSAGGSGGIRGFDRFPPYISLPLEISIVIAVIAYVVVLYFILWTLLCTSLSCMARHAAMPPCRHSTAPRRKRFRRHLPPPPP